MEVEFKLNKTIARNFVGLALAGVLSLYTPQSVIGENKPDEAFEQTMPIYEDIAKNLLYEVMTDEYALLNVYQTLIQYYPSLLRTDIGKDTSIQKRITDY